MLLQMEQLAGDMQAFGQGLGTRIELLANTSAISEHLIAPLGAFMQANPQLRLELRECTSDAIARALMAGEADMGVLSNAVPAGSLHTQVWRDDPLVLLGTTRLLAALPQDVQLHHLKDIALLGLLPQHALHQLMAAQALQAGVALRYRALAPHLEALCDWVAMGLGAALVPRTAAECATLRWAPGPAAPAAAERRLGRTPAGAGLPRPRPAAAPGAAAMDLSAGSGPLGIAASAIHGPHSRRPARPLSPAGPSCATLARLCFPASLFTWRQRCCALPPLPWLQALMTARSSSRASRPAPVPTANCVLCVLKSLPCCIRARPRRRSLWPSA
ncbi:LysR substrate-binding domain-containing protein [Comamonas sp. JC664]|uniref:LysR substrate-binding domain-containing protein n=1 Tax=Comamonas sp. JC664 TaxID=2801917 RepID=UPI00360D90B7